jgi:hypothetical protein
MIAENGNSDLNGAIYICDTCVDKVDIVVKKHIVGVDARDIVQRLFYRFR